jgi:ribosomal protein L37AE/L43A
MLVLVTCAARLRAVVMPSGRAVTSLIRSRRLLSSPPRRAVREGAGAVDPAGRQARLRQAQPAAAVVGREYNAKEAPLPMSLLMCPNCNEGMQEVRRNEVQIDVCPKCRGVWLDRGGRYKKRKKFSDIFDIFD